MQKYILIICILGILCSTVLTGRNRLASFNSQFHKMMHYRNVGDTSRAFSIAMKILIAVNTLKGQLEIQDNTIVLQTDSLQQKSCDQLLNYIVAQGNKQHWQNKFEQILTNIKYLNKKCTNMNFKTLKNNKASNDLGGFDDNCALCTVISRVMENYIGYHRKNITDFIENQVCNHFDGVVKPTCQAFTHYFGPMLIKAFLNKQNSDQICWQLKLCKNPNCKVLKQFDQEEDIEQEQYIPSNQPDIPSPWDWLVHIFKDKFGDGHLPPFDLDNDTFSDISSFRGYNWRGADCDEFDPYVYPGRNKGSKIIDNDCNDIYGINIKTGKTYQHDFCSNSTRLGVAVIGDSAGAHFSIPEKYFNVTLMKKGTFSDFLYRIANQLNIPQQSGYTGNTVTHGYTRHSVYKYLRQWNLCNNNDYQNIAVNGGDSGNTWGNIGALTRDQKNDYPLLMFLQLVGNDVCSKSFEGMTTVEQFRKNIIRLLQYLDKTVPSGSHLFILGLADGDLLFDNLHNQTHPLNVTYQSVYNFLNCLKISPCWGWLNSNATVRKFTTDRAKNLSKVYQQIIDSTRYKNFDMVYYDFPTMDILQRKIMQGGDPKDMIQKCDGFHPSGQFHSYLADWIWFKIQTQYPDWIGPANPHNLQIKKIFGSRDIK